MYQLEYVWKLYREEINIKYRDGFIIIGANFIRIFIKTCQTVLKMSNLMFLL
jgi:hypothetical protein